MTSSGKPPNPSTAKPDRFHVSRRILRTDRMVGRFILAGGVGVLLSVTALFLFILTETLPLFGSARVTPADSIETGIREPLLIGVDEWSELPFVLARNGSLSFFDLRRLQAPTTWPAPVPENTRITSATYLQDSQVIALGLDTGEVLTGRVRYQAVFPESGKRRINGSVDWQPPRLLPGPHGPIREIALFRGENREMLAAIVEAGQERRVTVLSRSRENDLFRQSAFIPDGRTHAHLPVTGIPRKVLIGADARHLVVTTENQTLEVFAWDAPDWIPLPVIRPFSQETDIQSIAFLQGRVALSLLGGNGRHLIYSLHRSRESGVREFGPIRRFPPFSGRNPVIASSIRNRALLLAGDQSLSLRYATTSSVRTEWTLDEPFHKILIGSRYQSLHGITAEGRLKAFTLHDPHPEAGFKAFFSRVWYEGQDRPRFIWQSTGGTDAFEPKLSLVPLILGSFKGTLYAMLFAVPVALLAAIYTSQFLSRGLRQVIKPAVELMASLPSVVLGFIAALWLAPQIEDRIPSVLLALLAMPCGAILMGKAWNHLPLALRIRIPKGWEFLLVLPVLALVSWIAWQSGPAVESVLFRYTDPVSGQTIADFRLWWEALTNSQFHQRNALVVGFMMGFAVIPIIYTIAEDALSSVPRSLSSGSLALGASRWQTTTRVVLPTASAGIFSAIMIGLARAVGETMIVVMATGNTPILDFDIFSGMRTVSANIAVELPEATQAGTLYRTLFFGAFLLFLLTFVINTFAEILRGRLRERYTVIH